MIWNKVQRIVYYYIQKKYLLRGWAYSFFMKKVGQSFGIADNCFLSGLEGISVGNNIAIQFGTVINGKGGLIIEDNVLLAHGIKIYTVNHIYHNCENDIMHQGVVGKEIRIKRGSWIAANAIILPGVTVGEHSVVAAGSIVTKDVPDFSVVAGNPAKVIKNIKND